MINMMRYFTDEKYQNGTAFFEYENYCKSIWLKVPLGIRQLCKGMLPDEFAADMMYELHDGRISKFEFNEKQYEVTIYYLIFDELDREHLLKANYKNAGCINLPQFISEGNSNEDCFCDIMCHEIFLTDDNMLHHTLLFASGAELVIEFSDFDLDVITVEA